MSADKKIKMVQVIAYLTKKYEKTLIRIYDMI